MTPFIIIIPGAPRTKKNHGQRLKVGGIVKNVPSAAYLQWNDTAQYWLARFRSMRDACNVRIPIAFPVNAAAVFYREALVGDAVGFYQGLADALQEGGILADDKWIVSWDGSRLRKDAERPRVEVTIATAEE